MKTEARETHKGPFRGIPATGRKFTLADVDIDRIVDGKSEECLTRMDELVCCNSRVWHRIHTGNKLSS
jgi:hypothetical protein